MEAPIKKQDSQVIIRVMPKEFLGREATLAEKPKPVPAPLPVAPKPPAGPLPGAIPAPAVSPKKKSKLPIILIAIGLLLMAGLALGGYFLLKSTQQPDETEVIPPVEEVPPIVETPPVEEEPPAEPQSGIDTDSDGLTDIEEGLYGTDHRNPDTDADSFLDGNEVFHRYDPLGYAPETLLDTGRVLIYEPSDQTFSIYYPKAWRAVVTPNGVSFRTADTARIEVAVRSLSDGETLQAWYDREIAPGNGAKDLQSGITKLGYQSLSTNDELAAYVAPGNNQVYVITYDLAEETTIEYLNTFQMMVNSLTVSL
jgi:hypothetical protein